MALPNRNGLEHFHLSVHNLDTALATACFVRSPVRGRLIRVKAAQYAVPSGGANVITCKINSTTVSGATLTLVSGGAAGDVYQATTTNSPLVQQGDTINFTSDGGSANATVTPATFVATIRRI